MRYLVLLLLASPVSAQSLKDWSGPFGGVSIGAADGAVAGAFAGYQQDLGGVVIGGEVEASTGEQLEEARLKLRIGAPLGNTLVYGLGGIGYSEGTIDGISGQGAGATFGIGIEQAVTDRLRIGAEITRDERDFGIGTPEQTQVRARLTLNF